MLIVFLAFAGPAIFARELRAQVAAPLPGVTTGSDDFTDPGDSLPPAEPQDSAPAPVITPMSPAQATPNDSDLADTEDAANYFYDDLTPYGQWVQVDDYGPCWQPTNVAPDWRPYTLGHWVFTDDNGWFWTSDEPFGWCTYHYGRWMLLPSNEWCWVPGRNWGAAWVVWKNGGGFVGWAPLPPARRGFSIEVAINTLHPFCFSFVDEKFMTDEHWRDHCEPITRNVTLIGITKNVTHIDRVNGRFVDRGIDVAEVEHVTGRRVEHVKIEDVKDRKDVRVSGDHLAVFRPEVPMHQGPAVRHFEPMPAVVRNDGAAQAARQQRDGYYQQLQSEMDQRHQHELAQPPAGRTPAQLQEEHQREVHTLEDHRQRMAQPPADLKPLRRIDGAR